MPPLQICYRAKGPQEYQTDRLLLSPKNQTGVLPALKQHHQQNQRMGPARGCRSSSGLGHKTGLGACHSLSERIKKANYLSLRAQRSNPEFNHHVLDRHASLAMTINLKPVS